MEFQWHIVPVLQQELPEGSIREITVEGRTVALLRTGHGIFAFSSRCPHAGASLCKGYVDARGQIVCAEHSYRFDPRTGRNTSGEEYRLKTYPLKVEGEMIYIGFS